MAMASCGRKLGQLLFCVGYGLAATLWLLVLLVMPRKVFHRQYARLEEKEFQARLKAMAPHIRPHDTVLDVGSGSGRFGLRLQDATGATVTGVDVVDYADAKIKTSVYDGTTLPFPDGQFDVVFLAFVLHHCRSHDPLFQEALRVARKKIIILEDTFDTPWQRLFVMWNDYHTNIVQGVIKVWKRFLKPGVTNMPMPLTFRSIAGWQQYFAQFPDITVETVDVRYAGYKPLTKVTFCLAKNS